MLGSVAAVQETRALAQAQLNCEGRVGTKPSGIKEWLSPHGGHDAHGAE